MSWTESGLAQTDFERLCSEVAPQAYVLLTRAGVAREDAEDLLQDCLVRLFEVWSQLRDPVAWFLSALHYAVLAHRRAVRARLADDLRCDLEARLQRPTAVDSTARLDLARAVARLSADQREILQLRFRHGLEPVDIARLKGCSTRNVRKRTALCLKTLRARLSAESAPPPLP